MIQEKLTWLFALLILAGVTSCKKDDKPVPKPDDPAVTYEQYGTSFKDVPETADVIMYEVNLRAFSPGGDLQGVIARLDEIKALSVNVIWLMPIHPIGQVNSVNSPYSVKDYKAVSSEYGTLQDLRMLTDEAHERGMAVIMDWVANHTGWDNAWIENKSWYTQDNNGNIIHPPGTNWQDVADLNYNTTEMREAMIDAMKYWVYEANVDGFRCDYADGVPFDFWKQALDSLKLIPEREFVFFAEGERRNHFDAGFDLNFGWESYGAIKNVFNGQPVSKIFTAHTNEYNNIQPGKHWIRYTTNHDESAWDATPIALFDGVDGALAASVATIFTGGVPLLYAGQEVGTANNVPFFSNSFTNWSANPAMKMAYQQILQYYSGSDVARKGANTNYPDQDIFCLKKVMNNEEILVLVNFRNNQTNFDIPPELQNTNWVNAITNEEVVLMNQLQMGAYSYLVLK